jgi:hypothetical protein
LRTELESKLKSIVDASAGNSIEGVNSGSLVSLGGNNLMTAFSNEEREEMNDHLEKLTEEDNNLLE